MIKLIYFIFKKKLFSSLINKILRKFEKNTNIKSTEWAEKHAIYSTEEFCKKIDNNLYSETLFDVEKIKIDSNKKFLSVKNLLGKPGNYLLIFFLVRKFKPKIVFETGVAAGWSSLAILRAFQKNKTGKLFSSDLPYIKKAFFKKIPNPDKNIGILAREEINYKDWTLNTRGDDFALKYFTNILEDNTIDLFHYDSDKSYSGRTNALKILKKKFTNKSIIIFDDIQDNMHFHDYVKKQNTRFTVIKYDQKKYVGIVGI